MTKALNEFSLRLAEWRNDLELLKRTYELRPRINQVLDFDKRGEVLELARSFGSIVGNQPATLYGPMLVRLVASFERFVRLLIRDAIDAWVQKAKTFDQLPDGLGGRNLVLSGRVIANSDSPREHLDIDLENIVDSLVTCRTGSTTFRLNSLAFMLQVTGVTPEIIENGLKLARITNWWDVVGADRPLQRNLNCTRTSDATKKAAARLKELSRWRNNWAHGGDEEVSLTAPELLEAADFLSLFSNALDVTVAKRIREA
jgi:hypothetical protein